MTDLPALHEAVAFGRSNGQIIWQPRISCWLNDKQFAGEPLPEPYEGMSLPEIYRSLGCSARIYYANRSMQRIEDPRVVTTRQDLGDGKTETVVETPVGIQRDIVQRVPENIRPLRIKWPVTSEEELKVATWRTENCSWRWNQEGYDAVLAEWGDLGAPTVFLPRMNIQDLYINTMGVQNAVYAIYDWPNTVEAYFKALDDSHDRLIDIVNDCPVKIINYGENVHSGTLPPDLFCKYHLPACQRRSERLHAAGKFICSHWDGDCNPLLPFAHETGLDGIEAITPQPQGDVTLEEVREALGDDMFLLDGIPAIYFDETFPVETLIACTEKVIELFAPRLILGISDELSSTGDIERIRIVGDIVDAYNRKVTA
jgi:hypothetical protein